MLFPELCDAAEFGQSAGPAVLRQTKPDPKQVRVSAILTAVAAAFGVRRDLILSDRRAPKLVQARHAAMWLAREHTNLSFPQIGRLMLRDHTTILHGARTAERRMRQDENYRAVVINALWVLDSQFERDPAV